MFFLTDNVAVSWYVKNLYYDIFTNNFHWNIDFTRLRDDNCAGMSHSRKLYILMNWSSSS